MKKIISLDELPVLDNTRMNFPDKEFFEKGVVIPIDKPPHFTSFDIVKIIRNRLPVKKVGHAGTLDPLATGLLLVCCGRATKSISQIQVLPKTYVAEITFGSSTPSFDSGTPADAYADWEQITQDEVDRILSENFSGAIQQVPPIYSAIRKDGRRLYTLARRGEEVEIEPRTVEIYNSEILSWHPPTVTFRIESGKGTYIRSVAHDLGKACGSLAYLSHLRRTKTGHFSVSHAWNLEKFKEWCEDNG